MKKAGETVVVLDRIEPGVKPNYCIHGRATCMGGCGEWVWLGHKTFEMVNSGHAQPLCMECMIRFQKLMEKDGLAPTHMGNLGDTTPHGPERPTHPPAEL